MEARQPVVAVLPHHVFQDGADTVVEVNNIFHQSMAPVEKKEYFYQWPYTVFGDTFDDVLILGAGTGTDVAAALRHGARHVDAVEIDPVILRLGAERHPDHPYSDPRVRAINDDARHFLATTEKKYDLIIFALIDSLTVQSSFSSVRLESYMFTEESFRAVRDHLKPRGVMALYNYFREKWLVDRLANTVTKVFGQEPRAHVHQDRAYLAVMLAGPRLAELTTPPPLPTFAFGLRAGCRSEPGEAAATDPTVDSGHRQLAISLHAGSRAAAALPGRPGGGPRDLDIALFSVVAFAGSGVSGASASLRATAHFFFLGAGFMLLETKSIVQFALLWGSDLVVGVVGHRVGTGHGARQRICRRPRRHPPPLAHRRHPRRAAGVELCAADRPGGVQQPGRRVAVLRGAGIQSGAVRRPAVQASYKQSSSTAWDFGANLFGAMVGGVCEYFSLLTGYQFLLVLVAGCYLSP